MFDWWSSEQLPSFQSYSSDSSCKLTELFRTIYHTCVKLVNKCQNFDQRKSHFFYKQSSHSLTDLWWIAISLAFASHTSWKYSAMRTGHLCTVTFIHFFIGLFWSSFSETETFQAWEIWANWYVYNTASLTQTLRLYLPRVIPVNMDVLVFDGILICNEKQEIHIGFKLLTWTYYISDIKYIWCGMHIILSFAVTK